MKKLIALLLMLCMLLAAVPALGEDYSGTWYLRIGRVSAGTLELNADGTGKLDTSAIFGEAFDVTWTGADEGVSLTVDGDTSLLAYDGSQMDFPGQPMLKFSREAGAITYEQLVNFQMTQEIPEGLTMEDMMAIATEILALQSGAEDTPAETVPEGNTGDESTPAADAGEPAADAGEPAADAGETLEATVLSENFIVLESYGDMRAYYFAKIQNNTETPFFVENGLFTLKDADGNVLDEQKYMSSRGSRYLEPGEITFIGFRGDVPEGVDNPQYTVSLNVAAESYSDKDVAVDVSGAEIGKDRYGYDAMRVAITNNTENFIPGISAIIALEDADGKILWLREEGLYSYELGPNSTLVLVSSIDSSALEYFTAQGIAPAQVEAYAYSELK